jgi:hypothetical protein
LTDSGFAQEFSCAVTRAHAQKTTGLLTMQTALSPSINAELCKLEAIR